MMATTSMISPRVKPERREVLVFMSVLELSFRDGAKEQPAAESDCNNCSLIACRNRGGL
jgi:hypothetical protein